MESSPYSWSLQLYVFSRKFRSVSSLALLGSILTFSLISCTHESSGDSPETGPVVIGGTNFKDMVARCGSQVQSGLNYLVTCSSFVSTPAGEFPIAGFKDGYAMNWLPSQVVQGSAPSQTDCSVSPDNLTQVCSITTADFNPLTLKFSANVTAPQLQSFTISDNVMLPYSIQTYGYVAEASFRFSTDSNSPYAANSKSSVFSGVGASLGVSNSVDTKLPHLVRSPLNPSQVRLNTIQSCPVNKGVFIADRDIVYLWTPGRARTPAAIQLYTGGPSIGNSSFSADRTKISYNSKIAIDCKSGPGPNDYTLYVLSQPVVLNGNQVSLNLTTITPQSVTRVRTVDIFPFNTQRIYRSLRVKDGLWYFTDNLSHVIWTASPNGKTAIFAGSSAPGPTTEGSQRLATPFQEPGQLTFLSNGDLYFSDYAQNKIFSINAQGIVKTAIGIGISGNTFSTNPLAASLAMPQSVAGLNDDIYVGDHDTSRVLVLHTKTGTLSQISGIANPAREVNALLTPNLSVGQDGSVYAGYTQDNGAFLSRLAKLSIQNGNVLSAFEWIVGISIEDEIRISGGFTDSTFQNQSFAGITDAVTAPDGTIYLTETQNNRILKGSLTDTGELKLTSIAGRPFTKWQADSPDGTLASEASIQGPIGIALAADGSLFFNENLKRVVKKIDANGLVQTVADLNGVPKSNIVSNANGLRGIAIFPDQSLAVSDAISQTILHLTPSPSGQYVVTTLIDVSSLAGLLPSDVNPNTNPFGPANLKTDAQGRLYFGTNFGMYRRESNGTIYRIAGGVAGSPGDTANYSGPANETPMVIHGVTLLKDGSLYVIDSKWDRLVQLIPDPDKGGAPTYHLNLIAASGNSKGNCGLGTLQARAVDSNAWKTSLAQVCLGRLLSTVVVDRCNGPQKDFTFFLSEYFDVGGREGNLVRVTRACQ